MIVGMVFWIYTDSLSPFVNVKRLFGEFFRSSVSLEESIVRFGAGISMPSFSANLPVGDL